jgi:NAD(P)H-hydrate epimerase
MQPPFVRGLYWHFMIRLYTPEASRRLDAECLLSGISEADLIDQASASCAEVVRHILSSTISHADRVSLLIVCGPGNNGADGLTVARLLSQTCNVTVAVPLDSANLSEGHRQARERLPRSMRIIRYDEVDVMRTLRPDAVIDAIFGSGARLPLDPTMGELTTAINSIDAPLISIDIPTGLDATTGKTDRNVVRCQHTIAMEGLKPGHLRADGPDVCGTVHVTPIGAPSELTAHFSDGAVLDQTDIAAMLPARSRRSTKFDHGHVLVVGGTLGMRGAPSMTAHAALAIGAGLVDLAAASIHPLTPREVMTTALPYTDDGSIAVEAIDVLRRRMERSTVVAIGPGLGSDHRTIAMLAELIESISAACTLVLDADGLRCLPLVTKRVCQLIITPHMGELARLIGKERQQIELSYVEHAQRAAADYDCIVHIKHVPAATVTPAYATYLQCGNPAMATAGSGDVLTGIIAGLCAQGMPAYDAARCGAWLHATAGDESALRTGKVSLMATELIEAAALVRADVMAAQT